MLVLVGHSQGANRAAETAQILATRGVPGVVEEVRKAPDGAVQTNSSTAPASSNRRPRATGNEDRAERPMMRDVSSNIYDGRRGGDHNRHDDTRAAP